MNQRLGSRKDPDNSQTGNRAVTKTNAILKLQVVRDDLNSGFRVAIPRVRWWENVIQREKVMKQRENADFYRRQLEQKELRLADLEEKRKQRLQLREMNEKTILSS